MITSYDLMYITFSPLNFKPHVNMPFHMEFKMLFSEFKNFITIVDTLMLDIYNMDITENYVNYDNIVLDVLIDSFGINYLYL